MFGIRDNRPHGAQWLPVGAFVVWGALGRGGSAEAVGGALFAAFIAVVLVSIYNRERGQ